MLLTACFPNAHTCCRVVGTAADNRRRRRNCRATPQDDLDPIERLVSSLFGKRTLEDRRPLGMKRLSDEALDEQREAVTDEFAAPLASDSPEVASFRPLMARTRLERQPLRLAYSAEEDGWTAEAFHSKVNTFGAAVLLASTECGCTVGAYNPRGWIGLGDERHCPSAFLFTRQPGQDQFDKLPKVGGGALAVIDKEGSGPQFGAEGLIIPLQPGLERTAKSRLGTYYANRPDGSRTLFAGNAKKALLTRLKVYVAEGEGETWSLDGIVWKSSSG